MEFWKSQNSKASHTDILLAHRAVVREERLHDKPRGCLCWRLKSVQTLWTLLTCTTFNTKRNLTFFGIIYHKNIIVTKLLAIKRNENYLHVKNMFLKSLIYFQILKYDYSIMVTKTNVFKLNTFFWKHLKYNNNL